MRSRKFDKVIAKYYDEVVDAGYHPQKEYIEDLLKIIPSESVILELGCGTGQISLPLIKNGITCECVDESKEMTVKLKKKLKIYNGSVEKFKPLKKYDYILSCNGPFQIKEKEIESYILEKEKLIKCIKRFVCYSRKGLLINKGKAKNKLRLKLSFGKEFFHEEFRSRDIVIMINTLFNESKYLGNINLVKRRYLKEDILQKFKVKDIGRFVLIKNEKE